MLALIVINRMVDALIPDALGTVAKTARQFAIKGSERSLRCTCLLTIPYSGAITKQRGVLHSALFCVPE